MALNITNFNPSEYASNDNKYAFITFTDDQPLYQDNGNGTYTYATPIYAWTSSTGGSRLGIIINFSKVLFSAPSTISFNSELVFVQIGNLFPITQYWLGGFSGGTRRSFFVNDQFNTISVLFDINEGTGTTPLTASGNSGSLFLIPTNSGFSRPGYNFTGWSTSPSGSANYFSGQTYFIYNTIFLYAIWQPINYAIIIDENGGANVNDLNYSINNQNQFRLLTRPAAPIGQVFNIWSIITNSTPTGSTVTTSTNTLSIPGNDFGQMIIRALYDYINYTITYDLGGGSGAHGNPTTYTYVTPTITLVQGSLTRAGYTFAGWFDAATGGNQVTSIPLNSTGNRTLYARWSIINYTITYTLNGGTNAAGNPTTYNIESNTITLANPTRNGYTFNGWYSEAAFTNQITEITTGSTGNTTLHAKWTATTYNITYTLNGGTNSVNNPATYNIESNTITLESATRTGYTFNGWYSESTFLNQVTQIASGSVGDRTLHAKFNINGYDVIFINDGVEVQNTEEEFGATITFNGDTPTKTDPKNRYFFLGWNTNMSATTPLASLGTVPVGGITFYAIYESFISGLKINLKDVNIKVGTTQVKAVYKGETLIWEDYNE